jgi:hypothetical protein
MNDLNYLAIVVAALRYSYSVRSLRQVRQAPCES